MPVAAPHIELHEGAGQAILFPRCGLFAGAQADNGIAHPHRLPRLQRDLATDAVALVEQSDDRDPFGHRRTAGRHRDVRGRDGFDRIALVRPVGGDILRGHRLPIRRRAMQRPVAEDAGQPQHHQQHAGSEPASRHPSGVQAS